MRRFFLALSLMLLTVIPVACSDGGDNVIKDGSDLHYILPPDEYEYPFIGDVHPFYDEDSQTWYMFYLDTSGSFNSRLLTSKNGINWEPTELKVHSGFNNYGVLNVFKKDDTYYTYYADYQSSMSTNLIDWYYSGGEYVIDRDSVDFPFGSRDPDVVYDAETDRFYSIAINYITKGVSNLAIGTTNSNDQTDWNPVHKSVLETPVTNSDYECPQLVKIGDRWYIFASRYGQSDHGVGRLSYFMGDKDVNPYDMDWTTVTERFLTTEDLCAAQVEGKGGKFYVFGWIPRYYDQGFWGGSINLPTEVYQLADGTLATRIADFISDEIRGEKYDSIDTEIEISNTKTASMNTLDRFDTEIYFEMGLGVLEIKFAESNTIINIEKNDTYEKVAVYVGNYKTSEMILEPGTLAGTNYLRIIGETRIVEMYLNNTYYIVSRVGDIFTEDVMTINMGYGSGTVIAGDSYRLKFREELINESEE